MVGEGTQPGKWQEAVSGHDVLINLAGVPDLPEMDSGIQAPSVRHTNSHHKKSGGRHSCGNREFGYSAEHFRRGLLRSTGDEELGESSPPGNDFLATPGP